MQRSKRSKPRGSLGGLVIQTSFCKDQKMDSAIFEIFNHYTKRYVELTDNELERIESVCTYKKLRKQQYLLQEGDIWKFHAFVASGCLRTYSIDEKGLEHIVSFGIDNWWVGDLESLKS